MVSGMTRGHWKTQLDNKSHTAFGLWPGHYELRHFFLAGLVQPQGADLGTAFGL